MREFEKRDLPEHYSIDWSSAEDDTAIFIGKNVFLDPDGNIMDLEIQEFKDIAKANGVLLAMRREYKKTVQDDKATLIGFWFYCVGTTPRKKQSPKHNAKCTHEVIKIFKAEPLPLRIQAILKNYGIPHSQTKIREALKYLTKIGYLEKRDVSQKNCHDYKGRPTHEYKRTDDLISYTVPDKYKDIE